MSGDIRRVFVTGASGLLGSAVVDHLHAKGIAVTALLAAPAETSETTADWVVVGDMRDVDVVRAGLSGADAVIHCAALRAPMMGTPQEVFLGNTAGTFTVLQEAAAAGIRRAVIASSYSALGLTFAPVTRAPAYLPIDEQIPLLPEDPYALSKVVDEETARYMARRHGMSVVALRFPFLGDLDGSIRERSELLTRDPAARNGSRELWTYLDRRDAARACLLGLTRPISGAHAVLLGAPTTLLPYPTEQLLDRYHPGVERRRSFPGRAAAFDLDLARDLLGFEAEHVLDLAPVDMDPAALPTVDGAA